MRKKFPKLLCKAAAKKGLLDLRTFLSVISIASKKNRSVSLAGGIQVTI